MENEEQGNVWSFYQSLLEEIIKKSHVTNFCLNSAGVCMGFYSDDTGFLAWAPEHFTVDYRMVTERMLEYDAEIYHTGQNSVFEQIRQLVPSHNQMPSEHAKMVFSSNSDTAVFYQHFEDQHVSGEYYAVLDKAQRRILLISRGDHTSLSLLIMRTIRQLLHYLAIEKGWTPFHSACCAWGNTGICIVGDKFTGKTTTLMSLLETGKTSLLSNDKLLLAAPDGALQAIALPHKIGIRIGTVLLSEHLRMWLKHATPSTYPQPSLASLLEVAQNLSESELRINQEKVFFMPYELAKAFDTCLIPQVEPGLFLLPVYDSSLHAVKIEHLPPDIACEQLLSHYLPLADQGSDFLRFFFSFDDQMLFERLSMLFTNYLKVKPVYRVYQNKETRLEAIRQIQELLARERHLDWKDTKNLKGRRELRYAE